MPTPVTPAPTPAPVSPAQDADDPTLREARRALALDTPDVAPSRRPALTLGAIIPDPADVSIGNSSGRSSRDTGDVRVGGGPVLNPPTASVGGKPIENGSRVGMQGSAAGDEPPAQKITIDTTLLSVYMDGVKRCYKKYLNVDPTLRTKLVLMLRFDATGRVDYANASGVPPQLSSCILALTKSWQLPPPRDESGKATEAAIRRELVLIPQ